MTCQYLDNEIKYKAEKNLVAKGKFMMLILTVVLKFKSTDKIDRI